MKNEPIITINGIVLTSGQSKTVRVAIDSFYLDLVENGLGDDQMGVSISEAYLENLEKLLELLIRDPQLIELRGNND